MDQASYDLITADTAKAKKLIRDKHPNAAITQIVGAETLLAGVLVTDNPPAPTPAPVYETIGAVGTRTILDGKDGLLSYKKFVGATQIIGPAETSNCMWAGPSGVISDLRREESLLWIKEGAGVHLGGVTEIFGSKWHAGLFISSGGFLVDEVYAHDNGGSPDLNQDHGIYWAHGQGGELAIVRTLRNRDRGLQIYPDVTDAVIGQIEAANNGTGIQWGDKVARCVIGKALVHNNTLYGLRSYQLTGLGNAAGEVHSWANGTNVDAPGVAITNLVEVAP
jgi:hypothetical protein